MRIILVSVYAILFSGLIVCAQRPAIDEYSLRQLTEEEGLPQNSVRSIVHDELGFIWLATEQGLVRYDGKSFKIFTKKSLGIESDRFYQFQRNAATGEIYAYSEFNRAVRISGGTATVDSANLFIRDIDRGPISAFIRLKLAEPEMIRRTLSRDFKQQHLVVTTKTGRYFACFNQKVVIFQSGKVAGVVPFLGPSGLAPFQAPGDTTPNLKNFMSTGNELFYHQTGVGIEFIHVSQRGNRQIRLGGDITRHPMFVKEGHKTLVFVNKINNQLIATLGDHIYLVSYDPQKKTLSTCLVLEGLDTHRRRLSSFYFDSLDGTLYAGSQTGGMYILSQKALQTVTTKGDDYENIFYAQHAINDSTVVLPNGRMATENGFIRQRLPGVDTTNTDGRFTILRDHSGNIWYRTKTSVLKISGGTTQSVTQWISVIEPSRLYQGQDSLIWVGFRNGDLAIVDQTDVKNPFHKVASTGADITFLFQIDENKLWVGTNKGLFCWDSSKKQLSVIDGMQQKNIRSITTTAPDQIWVTTYGDGIFLLRKDKILAIPSDLRGYLNYAHCLVADEKGYFWISTNKGLFQAQINDLVAFADRKLPSVFFRYYSRADGLRINEFNGGCQPCGIRLGNGYISLPSMNGLVFIPPGIPTPSSLTNPFIVDKVEVSGKSVSLNDTIRLEYDFGSLSIQLATPFFMDRENLNIAYSIDPVHKKGKGSQFRVADDLKINIFNLPTGEYRLNIRKMAGFGSQYIEKKIVLMISPAWFATWWFVCLMLVLLAGLLIGYNMLRTRALRSRNRDLSRRVDERTKELSQTMGMLEESQRSLQRQLQVQMRIIAVLGHDLRSPLKFLIRYSKKLHELLATPTEHGILSEMSWGIAESASKTYELADNLLGFVKATTAQNGKVDESLVPVKQVLQEKAAVFDQLAKERHSQIRLDTETSAVMLVNRQFLAIIIHNLLDNAIKIGWQDTITLSAHSIDNKAIVTISDTAGNLPENIVAWLNSTNSVNQSANNTAPPDLGLGLIIVKELADLAGLTIQVHSDSSGTTFRMFKV
ncbi:sensor histidine kinase [Dyadobacter sp. BHUBP1]|uniref:sensor histidine kinase n=1 Tax=Dyadobacter sp. BHUBP1 TaxID=3424178 RepID=UPI003D3592BD